MVRVTAAAEETPIITIIRTLETVDMTSCSVSANNNVSHQCYSIDHTIDHNN